MLKMFSFFKNKTLNNKLLNLSVQKIKVFDVASTDSNFWHDVHNVDNKMMQTPSNFYLGFTKFVHFLKNEMHIIGLSFYTKLEVVLSRNNNKYVFKIIDVKKCYLFDDRDLVFILKNGDLVVLSCLDKKVSLYLMTHNFLWKDFSYGFNENYYKKNL